MQGSEHEKFKLNYKATTATVSQLASSSIVERCQGNERVCYELSDIEGATQNGLYPEVAHGSLMLFENDFYRRLGAPDSAAPSWGTSIGAYRVLVLSKDSIRRGPSPQLSPPGESPSEKANRGH